MDTDYWAFYRELNTVAEWACKSDTPESAVGERVRALRDMVVTAPWDSAVKTFAVGLLDALPEQTQWGRLRYDLGTARDTAYSEYVKAGIDGYVEASARTGVSEDVVAAIVRGHRLTWNLYQTGDYGCAMGDALRAQLTRSAKVLEITLPLTWLDN